MLTKTTDSEIQILTQSIEKIFLVDSLTTNNAIYCDSLTLVTL